MAYVKKIIGKDEHIIGIARLHWIYLAKGLFGFAVCLTLGLAFDAILFRTLTAISEMAPNTGGKLLAVANSWVTPLFVIFGGAYFLLYLLKVLYTEIALTEKRIIHKSGFIFVKINEIDIEEISAENMDMGYFGSLLGYGYIMLDCRFVGDIKLPAIGHANTFVKALHAARTKVTPMYPDAAQVSQALVQEMPQSTSDEKPQHEMLKPQEPKPSEPSQQENHEAAAMAPPVPETDPAIEHDHEKEMLQLQIAKLELEVKLKEIESAETDNSEKLPQEAALQTTQPIAPVNIKAAQSAMPEITKMPQVTDKIAEELMAQGLIPHPDEIKPEKEYSEEPLRPKAPTDEERLEPTKTDALINSFGGAAFVFKSMEDGNAKPEPAI